MFGVVPQGYVRRRCPSCKAKNLVHEEHLGTKCRCASCGALLYPEEFSAGAPSTDARPVSPPPESSEPQVVVKTESDFGAGFFAALMIFALLGLLAYEFWDDIDRAVNSPEDRIERGLKDVGRGLKDAAEGQ